MSCFTNLGWDEMILTYFSKCHVFHDMSEAASVLHQTKEIVLIAGWYKYHVLLLLFKLVK